MTTLYGGSNSDRKKVCVLLIDPQVDFCEPYGSLFVPGAVEDCVQISKFIENKKKDIDSIVVTLDTHQRYHIAHPRFWVDEDGENRPKPFTEITFEDVKNGKWRAFTPEHQKIAEDYLGKPDENGVVIEHLTIWPEHCLIGSVGHTVQPGVMGALKKWEEYDNRSVLYVLKGTNAFSEHFSAIRAEQIRDDDPKTDVNQSLLDHLNEYETILVMGEARSHCVKATIEDIIQYGLWKSDENSEKEISVMGEKIILCSDASSAIPGFEEAVGELHKTVITNGGEIKDLNEIFTGDSDELSQMNKAEQMKSLIEYLGTFYDDEFIDRNSKAGQGVYKNPAKKVFYEPSAIPSGDASHGMSKATNRGKHTNGTYRVVMEKDEIHIYGKDVSAYTIVQSIKNLISYVHYLQDPEHAWVRDWHLHMDEITKVNVGDKRVEFEAKDTLDFNYVIISVPASV